MRGTALQGLLATTFSENIAGKNRHSLAVSVEAVGRGGLTGGPIPPL